MKEEDKLIAEFMGFKIQDNPNERFYNQYFTEPNGTWGSRIEITHFDSSWDWLMPVVSKITKMDNYIGLMQRENIMDTIPYGLIDDVYEYVVQFIKYYNHERSI